MILKGAQPTLDRMVAFLVLAPTTSCAERRHGSQSTQVGMPSPSPECGNQLPNGSQRPTCYSVTSSKPLASLNPRPHLLRGAALGLLHQLAGNVGRSERREAKHRAGRGSGSYPAIRDGSHRDHCGANRVDEWVACFESRVTRAAAQATVGTYRDGGTYESLR